VSAVRLSGLESVLAELPGPLTVFVPSDAAFRKLPGAELKKLLQEGNERLVRLLKYHVVEGDWTAANALAEAPAIVSTLLSSEPEARSAPIGSFSLRLTPQSKYEMDELKVWAAGNAANVDASLETPKFVVHVVDNVLEPPGGCFKLGASLNLKAAADGEDSLLDALTTMGVVRLN
jgi:uncharacterized surface protein with fasciclin (FAS1) repeats